VQSYLRYQGKKLVERCDANTYLGLVEAMDSHDMGRGRGPLEKALAAIDVPTLAVGITSDVVYPIAEVQALAAALPDSRYETLVASHGHDSFLIETDDLDRIVTKFVRDVGQGRPAVQPRYLTTGEGAARQ
jgi:homoserine O-acetyltransferase